MDPVESVGLITKYSEAIIIALTGTIITLALTVRWLAQREFDRCKETESDFKKYRKENREKMEILLKSQGELSSKVSYLEGGKDFGKILMEAMKELRNER
jgi:hypothetical protein